MARPDPARPPARDHLAVHDFGTGWASLQSLRELRPHTLKIDRSLLRDLDTDSTSRAIVQAILAMAEHLRITVTAEGIETARQLDLIATFGCPQGQGFFLAAPTAAPQLDPLLPA